MMIHPTRSLLSTTCGRVFAPAIDRPKKTRLGSDMEGWADKVLHTPRGRIIRWLREHPAEAREIAFAAIAGLYLDDDGETVLPEHDSNPRGSGSDYVDEVGDALEREGVMPLIRELQGEEEGEG